MSMHVVHAKHCHRAMKGTETVLEIEDGAAEPLLKDDHDTNEDVSAPDTQELNALVHMGSAGQGPLLHLLRKYHETLRHNGLKEEASKIVADAESKFAAFVRRVSESEAEKLTGTDLVLKDGFRHYLERVSHVLQAIDQQVRVSDWSMMHAYQIEEAKVLSSGAAVLCYVGNSVVHLLWYMLHA